MTLLGSAWSLVENNEVPDTLDPHPHLEIPILSHSNVLRHSRARALCPLALSIRIPSKTRRGRVDPARTTCLRFTTLNHLSPMYKRQLRNPMLVEVHTCVSMLVLVIKSGCREVYRLDALRLVIHRTVCFPQCWTWRVQKMIGCLRAAVYRHIFACIFQLPFIRVHEFETWVTLAVWYHSSAGHRLMRADVC
jgi:hypothetical protein